MASSWTMRGEYIESCNCDYLCPCIYTNPQEGATHDHCISLMVYRIEEGAFDGVSLAGLCFALVIHTNKVMADGDWIFACVIDERADEAQRAALTEILAGRAGGRPAMIHDNLVGEFRGIAVSPITVEAEGHNRTTDAGAFSFAINGVVSRAGNGDVIWIDNVSHPAGSRLALARTSELHLDGFDLKLDMSGMGNNGHFAPFAWSN